MNEICLTTEIGSKLIYAREQAGLTESQAAKKLGIEWGLLVKIEQGNGNLSRDLLLSMCELYDMDSEWIMSSEKKERPEFDGLKKISMRDGGKITKSDMSNYLGFLATLKG